MKKQTKSEPSAPQSRDIAIDKTIALLNSLKSTSYSFAVSTTFTRNDFFAAWPDIGPGMTSKQNSEGTLNIAIKAVVNSTPELMK